MYHYVFYEEFSTDVLPYTIPQCRIGIEVSFADEFESLCDKMCPFLHGLLEINLSRRIGRSYDSLAFLCVNGDKDTVTTREEVRVY